MAKIQKIVYDKESKVFSIKISNKKSVDSDIQRNVVIDYDKDGKVAESISTVLILSPSGAGEGN